MTGTFKSFKCHKRNSVHWVNIMTAQFPVPFLICAPALWPLALLNESQRGSRVSLAYEMVVLS